MYKQADWDVNLQTDNGPLPIKGEIKATISATPETAAILGATGGGTLGYLLGPEHKGWRAVTTLAGALLGGSGMYVAATKLASVQKEAKTPRPGSENWIKPSGQYTNIGGSGNKRNPLVSFFQALNQPRVAEDPSGKVNYKITQGNIDQMATAWQQFKNTQAGQQYFQRNASTPRGFINPYAPKPSYMYKRVQKPANPPAK